MIVAYVDSSALFKRVVDDQGADEARRALTQLVSGGNLLVSSSLAWIEVSRALPRVTGAEAPAPDSLAETALSGVAEQAITAAVVGLARRLGPPGLRSLEAIHLASAILADASVLLTCDERLAAAARGANVTVEMPGLAG